MQMNSANLPPGLGHPRLHATHMSPMKQHQPQQVKPSEPLEEICIAVAFLQRLLKSSGLSSLQLELFGNTFSKQLHKRYEAHWYPETPLRGNAFRCLRCVNNTLDDAISTAASKSGCFDELKRSLPVELTMWIDPGSVSYRIGENGSVSAVDVESLRATLAANRRSMSQPSIDPSCAQEATMPSPSTGRRRYSQPAVQSVVIRQPLGPSDMPNSPGFQRRRSTTASPASSPFSSPAPSRRRTSLTNSPTVRLMPNFVKMSNSPPPSPRLVSSRA